MRKERVKVIPHKHIWSAWKEEDGVKISRCTIGGCNGWRQRK